MRFYVIEGRANFSGNPILTANGNKWEKVIRLTISEHADETHLKKIAQLIFSDDQKRKALISFIENMRLFDKNAVITILNNLLLKKTHHTHLLPLKPDNTMKCITIPGLKETSQ